MILKDTFSVSIIYDGENEVVPISPNSPAEGVEEENGSPTSRSDLGKDCSLQISTSLLVFTIFSKTKIPNLN